MAAPSASVSATLPSDSTTLPSDSTTLPSDSTTMPYVSSTQVTATDYLAAVRPFWWMYLALLVVLIMMIVYVKRDVLLDRCRNKDPREHITRLDVSAFNVEILVTCRPPPSYDQAMGLTPQGPPPHELPPKHPPLPEDVKTADTFNVWFG